MNITYQEERLAAGDYIDFLKRTNLGSQCTLSQMILLFLFMRSLE